MSTFLIIKPEFEKITNLKKGWTQSGNMLQGVASSFGWETGFMILWILELVS